MKQHRAAVPGSSGTTISVLLAIGPLTGILFGLYTSYISWRDSPFRKVPYPPGPPSNSLLQCTRDAIHPSRLWKVYSDWLKVYGITIYTIYEHGGTILI